ncbi:MAG: type II/IV secretion system protein, partial [Planctomycetes bacterium]|nr:type II/IV secretion system protein [Planctomycetota bacterium]
MSEATAVGRAKPVGEILVDRKLITREQIAEALQVQKSSDTRKLLGEIIVELGFCTAVQVAEALADTYDVPFARITPDLPDPKIIRTLPRDFIEENTVLPLFKVDDVLTVAVTEPSNVFLIEEIAQLAGCSVQIVAAVKSDIENTLKTYRPGADGFVIEDMFKYDDGDDGEAVDLNSVIDAMDLESQASDAPAVRLVNHLIQSAVREGASDIHVEPDEQTLRVRFR